jgi:hypothetical protein
MVWWSKLQIFQLSVLQRGNGSAGKRNYKTHFDQVWKACTSDEIDFAWQEIMNAEHKNNTPNSTVILSKARYRGFERDIFQESLLRMRTKAIRAIAAAYKEVLLSMTMSPEEQQSPCTLPHKSIHSHFVGTRA